MLNVCRGTVSLIFKKGVNDFGVELVRHLCYSLDVSIRVTGSGKVCGGGRLNSKVNTSGG